MNSDLITKADLLNFEKSLLNQIAEQIIKLSARDSKWIKSNDVQNMLGCSASTLQNLRNNGVLPFAKFGGTIYYDYYEILKIMEENKIQLSPTKQKAKRNASEDEWNVYG